MNDERIIPTKGQASVATVSLLVDGSDLPPTVEILSVVVQREANRVPSAHLVIRDGDVAAEDFPTSNEQHFVPGRKIEIRAGHASQEQTIFKGIFVKLGIKVRNRGGSALIVECRDEVVKMTVGRKSKFFVDKTDTEVINDLVDQYGLQSDVADTAVKHPELVQYHARDWDFMLSRADANGLLVMVDDGSVNVQPPKLSGSPDLSILLGDTIFELDAQMDARHQFSSVTAQAWDYSSQKVNEKEGTPTESLQGNIPESELAKTIGLGDFRFSHTGRVDDLELKAWADAQHLRSSLAKIVGRAQIQGFPEVKLGQLVQLGGVGKRFNGTALVTGIRHEINQGEWRTEIQFGRSPEVFAERDNLNDLPAAGLVPVPHGLQIGIAKAIEGDPKDEDRIQVTLPMIDPAAEGIWARWACPDAGDERGMFFRPEIGDELIVGFLGQDPRDPVILGMVHSSKKRAPIPLSKDNNEKAIVTRSKLRLHFNDKNKVLTLDTPGKNSLVLSDEEESITLTDPHGNSITMNSDGIALNAKTITIKSQKEIEIQAGSDLKANSNKNMELNASAQLKADGSAGADFTSSAVATIKGSLVKIN